MTRSYAGPSPFCLDTLRASVPLSTVHECSFPEFFQTNGRLKETIVRLCLRRPVLWSHRKQLREGQ